MAQDRTAAATDDEASGRPPATDAGPTDAETVSDAEPEEDRNGDSDGQPIASELEEMNGQLRRALADLDNVRKRFTREVERERTSEREHVVQEWLPVVDNLSLALEHAPATGDPVTEGVRVVLDQALGVLARLGFPRFLDIGERFDPRRHEAIGSVDADAPPGTVVATLRPGYGTGQSVLRPASVVVSKGG
ncbi:MAG: grpE [Actinomycetia bacterium]|nr:grpE [Actinomycetes bacterium]